MLFLLAVEAHLQAHRTKSSFVADCQLPELSIDSCTPCVQELGKASGLDLSTSQTNSSMYAPLSLQPYSACHLLIDVFIRLACQLVRL